MNQGRIVRMVLGMLVVLSSVAGLGGARAALQGPNITAETSQVSAYPPLLGIRFTGGPNQCGGLIGDQWRIVSDTANAEWTTPVLINTNDRAGGCDIAFGVSDPDNVLQGLSLTVKWLPFPGANAGQCLRQGTYSIPIQPFASFSPLLGLDTDGRSGGCQLIFGLKGRDDVVLDIRYWGDGDLRQCRPPATANSGIFRSVFKDMEIMSGVDTDDKDGGCWLSLRLRQG